jgi:hypothetical protein
LRLRELHEGRGPTELGAAWLVGSLHREQSRCERSEIVMKRGAYFPEIQRSRRD